jgi:hypothetical protein
MSSVIKWQHVFFFILFADLLPERKNLGPDIILEIKNQWFFFLFFSVLHIPVVNIDTLVFTLLFHCKDFAKNVINKKIKVYTVIN